MIEKRQLTVDVHKINTTRFRGDLVIKKDRLENELKLLQVECRMQNYMEQDDLAKSHGRVYDDLEEHRREIEKELTALTKLSTGCKSSLSHRSALSASQTVFRITPFVWPQPQVYRPAGQR